MLQVMKMCDSALFPEEEFLRFKTKLANRKPARIIKPDPFFDSQ
jgi:hypothetical protein